MIKYVIFDFDGTLVDSKEVAISIFNQLAVKYNFNKLKREDLELLRRLSIKERCRLLNLPLYKLPLIIIEVYSLYKQAIKSLLLFDGVKDLLVELKSKGYQVAIISSNSENNIREFLKQNQMESIKEVFCSNNIFGKDKVIKRFLREFNLNCSEVIYVGDELRDIVACRKIDIKIVWVGWGYDVLDTVKQHYPDFIVNSPHEIVDVIQPVVKV